ncbi:MAG TPA: LCP family protein [Treponemataceae bacterium]|jgi:anionic cell wall polymer biosynthesis LytR-Cps2A-Psr (LCP) family protein|nr:LCP family protein [Treponemataceae bacterium]HPX14331.1 LCP family protein [Treponemataceae bacterium]HQB88562.1 LCP family protein [Treponemataceae bacterium]HQF72966.1 LCP family protein [Treponemataceae bacterium]
MRSMKIDRSVFFLFVILAVLIGAAVILVFAMRNNPVRDALSGDQLLKVLVVLEDEGVPLSTNLIAYYPGTKRAAMFDIPGETGLIIKSLGRVDRIDAVYVENGMNAYRQEIEKLTGIEIPFSISFNLDQFSRLTDLLSGLSVFIPTEIDLMDGDTRVLLPSGAVTLDGDKIRTYVTYLDELDQEGENAARKQRSILAFFRALNDNAEVAFSKDVFPVLYRNMETNLRQETLKQLLQDLYSIDAERLIPQRITGSLRDVDGKQLLFPFYDGQLLKDIIRQTLGGLASEDAAAQERIYAIEILNGTDKQGLAQRTSELYQSFGYDVIRVGNAETSDYTDTLVIDRIGNEHVAKIIAQIIQCEAIRSTLPEESSTDLYGTEAIVDYTIILGKDFNGRYVLSQ